MGRKHLVDYGSLLELGKGILTFLFKKFFPREAPDFFPGIWHLHRVVLGRLDKRDNVGVKAKFRSF